MNSQLQAIFQYDREELTLAVPANSIFYESHYPPADRSAAQTVLEALDSPVAGPSLREALRQRRNGEVVIVVSDITRPIPYREFLPKMLDRIVSTGVKSEEILLLIATGMHRPSTSKEREEMFGRDIVSTYRIRDHRSGDDKELAPLPGDSNGRAVRLNRHYLAGGFRIVTGLVEPHFMAGFSGGRKAICPGLAALETIQQFHGYEILSDPRATNGLLEGNPCHAEALTVARRAGADFSLNIVMNSQRQLVRAFAGPLEPAHQVACDFSRQCACPPVIRQADVVLTSSGGYPLDATFYQCVKGMVTAIPAVREGGTMISFGGCSEGIGSKVYAETMARYAGRWRDYLYDLAASDTFIQDQWEFQMQCRPLAKLGQKNLRFLTSGLIPSQLDTLSVTGLSVPAGQLQAILQKTIDQTLATGQTLAVLPEGPYCAPISGETLS